MAARVKHGTLEVVGDQYVGMSVGDLRGLLKKDLIIRDGAPALVSKGGGEPMAIGEDYTLQHGDELQFVKASGEKGSSE